VVVQCIVREIVRVTDCVIDILGSVTVTQCGLEKPAIGVSAVNQFLPICFVILFILISGYCLHDCSGMGACNYTNGVCACEPRWSGEDCTVPECPDDCGGKHECVSGECVCDPGWMGSNCNTSWSKSLILLLLLLYLCFSPSLS
jgi:hypothetical protein